MWQVQGTGQVHRGFRWGNLKKKHHLEDPEIDDKIILT
jgi:hypothetical protein